MTQVRQRTLAPQQKTADYSQVEAAVLHVMQTPSLHQKLLDLLTQPITDARQSLLDGVQGSHKKSSEELQRVFGDLNQNLEARLHEVEKRTNAKVTITRSTEAKEPEVVRVLDGLFHKGLPELLVLLQTGNPLVLTGPTQSGKSKSVEMAAEALDLSYYYHAFGPTQTETALAGFNSATGEFVFRSLYLAVKYGGIWCGDEADVVRDAGVLIWMNNGVSNGVWSFPVGTKSAALVALEADLIAAGKLDANEAHNTVAGGQIRSHPDLRVVLTMNTAGEGGSMTYAGRGRLDKSTLARFDFIYWGYDEALEDKLVLALPGADIFIYKEKPEYATKYDLADWTNWCQSVRAAIKEERLDGDLIVSPSHTLRGARNLLQGLTWTRATELSLLPLTLDSGLRERVLSGAHRFYKDRTGRMGIPR